jgi:glyoxylase-like metal-dependent hydrolase (beta-lactamase superfamily II)
VLIVDTQQSTAAARSLIAEIARLTSAPVRWVVNTHWHGDHVNGNQAYAEAFPGVEFIAHESVGEDLRTLGSARRLAELEELPASIALRRAWLRDGAGPDGSPMTADQRRSVERSLALREAYSHDLARIVPTEPSRTITDQLLLTVGNHEVLLMHAGPAHTRGDLIVYLPQSGILAVGDLLEAGVPYFEDSFPAGWLRAVDRIAALRPDVILPAHGSVTRDDSLVDEARSLLSAIVGRSARLPPAGDGNEYDSGIWHDLAERWNARYGVSATAFTAAMQTAVARARLEQESR